MPWARFEDDYLGNRKLTTLSTEAIALDMAGIVYSARELRDGQLALSDVQMIATLIHIRKWQPVAAELVRVNRWVEAEGGYAIHDYLEYQPSRQQVLEERAAAAERMRRVREKSGRSSPERSPERTPERSPEVREKFALPVPGPGPGPGPERSSNVLGDTPLPPFGESSDEVRANGTATPRARRTKSKPEPPLEQACCGNFAATGSEHWQFCPNAAGTASA